MASRTITTTKWRMIRIILQAQGWSLFDRVDAALYWLVNGHDVTLTMTLPRKRT